MEKQILKSETIEVKMYSRPSHYTRSVTLQLSYYGEGMYYVGNVGHTTECYRTLEEAQTRFDKRLCKLKN